VYRDHEQTSDGPYRLREELTAAGPEHIRLEMRSNQMAPMLLVYDGRKLLVHDAEEYRPWTLYDAPNEHPDALSIVSNMFAAPESAVFAKSCRSAKVVGHKTVLGRAAVGYHCGAQHFADGVSQSALVEWLDQRTGVLLQVGGLHATVFDESPVITGATFSTRPPAGAKVEHFAARRTASGGKAAPGFDLRRVDADGRVRLSDHASRPLVLAFFASDIYFDPHGEDCRRCLPALLTVQRLTAGGTDPAVLAVQGGEEGKPGYPLIPRGLHLPVGNDPGFDVEQSYGLSSQVAFAFIGSDGTVRKEFDRPPTDAELRAALADLR
jgi:hypothetical protein